MGKAYDAAQKFANAKSEANLQKRLDQYANAHQASEHAIALYDQRDIFLHLLRDALHLVAETGKRRTVAGVRSELTRLFTLLEELDGVAITKTLHAMKAHLADIFVPCKQAEGLDGPLLEVVPLPALEALGLAWRHHHLLYPSPARTKRSHQSAQQRWLAFAAGRLDDDFGRLKTLVFEKLDALVRASSLVEMVNAVIRPSLNSCKGHSTQEPLHLIMFSHNHRRYKSGKRKGKAPSELLTGEPLQAQWWELLLQQVKRQQDAPEPCALPSAPQMQLVVNNEGQADRQAISPRQAIGVLTGVSEPESLKTDPEAA